MQKIKQKSRDFRVLARALCLVRSCKKFCSIVLRKNTNLRGRQELRGGSCGERSGGAPPRAPLKVLFVKSTLRIRKNFLRRRNTVRCGTPCAYFQQKCENPYANANPASLSEGGVGEADGRSSREFARDFIKIRKPPFGGFQPFRLGHARTLHAPRRTSRRSRFAFPRGECFTSCAPRDFFAQLAAPIKIVWDEAHREPKGSPGVFLRRQHAADFALRNRKTPHPLSKACRGATKHRAIFSRSSLRE